MGPGNGTWQYHQQKDARLLCWGYSTSLILKHTLTLYLIEKMLINIFSSSVEFEGHDRNQRKNVEPDTYCPLVLWD